MSQKPVLNAQECDPSTLGLARKPRPAVKRKPQTEVVVQLGPFTDGQITAPEMVRPLEGPTEWLIKPKTGEIVPFDSGTPPDKDVIRKYITVGAQDNEAPQELPKLSEGYVVERVNQDPLPTMDSVLRENGNDIIRVVEKEGPASVECKDPPPSNPPVTENEDPPPVDPPVDEEDDCECPEPPICPPPICPPVDEHDECDPVPNCPTVDAVNDCASTKAGCSVLVDVLKNDIGCGELKITEACAENGTVEIKDGKLHYTPNEGFCGEDVISYTIGDESCLTDTAHVYMNIEPSPTTGSNDDCPVIDNPNESGGGGNSSDPCVNYYEHSSNAYDLVESIFDDANGKIQDILDKANSISQNATSWSSNFDSSSMDSMACAPAEEPVAVC